jgi:hypothetical protein
MVSTVFGILLLVSMISRKWWEILHYNVTNNLPVCDRPRTPSESGDICIMTLKGLKKACNSYVTWCSAVSRFCSIDYLTHEMKVKYHTCHFSRSRVKHVS